MRTKDVNIKNTSFENLLFDLDSRIKITLVEALFNHYSIEKVCIELKETIRIFRKENGLIPKKLIP